MDATKNAQFIDLWAKYFPGAELPISFYYSDSPEPGETPGESGGEHRCLVAHLNAVRKGRTLCLSVNTVACSGGRRYLGFTHELMASFEYFLSCGVPGGMAGERYKKTPDIVKALMKQVPPFHAPAPYIIFKRWDTLAPQDEPAVVIFFAPPDVLSGLFTLAGFEESDPFAVCTPFSSGCGSIVQYPYLEAQRERPRAVLGMFDVSARPWVPRDTLTLALPMAKFTRMIDDIEESFLTTPSWARVKARL